MQVVCDEWWECGGSVEGVYKKLLGAVGNGREEKGFHRQQAGIESLARRLGL